MLPTEEAAEALGHAGFSAAVAEAWEPIVATEEEKEGWGSFDTRALDPERRAELQVHSSLLLPPCRLS